MFSTVAVIIT